MSDVTSAPHDSHPADAAPRGEIPLPSTASVVGWGIAASTAMAMAGAAHWLAKSQFRAFEGIAVDGWGVLASSGFRGAMDFGSLYQTALGFAAAGVAVPALVAWWIARRADVLPFRAALACLLRPILAGLMGGAVFLWFAGFRAPASGPHDYKDIWTIWNGFTLVVAIGGLTYVATRGRRRDGSHLALAPPRRWGAAAVVMAALAASYALAFCWLSLTRHWVFGTDLHDLGLYDQMLWNLAHGGGFRVTTWQDAAYDLRRYGNNFVAEHFMPILWLMAPLYWLHAGAENPLVVQSLALGASGWALFAFARRQLGSDALALALGAGWLLHPIVQQTNIKDFHADALVPAFLFGALWAWSARRPVAYGVLLAAFFACKEETSLLAAGLGVYLLLRREWKWGGATLAAALAWYAIAILWIIPAARDGEPLRHLYRYAHLAGGEEPRGLGHMALWSLTHPLEAVRSIATHERVRSLLLLFTPVALVSLVSVRAWVLMFVPVAAALGSNWFVQYRFELHYGLSSLMFVFVAAVFGAERLLGRPRDGVAADGNDGKNGSHGSSGDQPATAGAAYDPTSSHTSHASHDSHSSHSSSLRRPIHHALVAAIWAMSLFLDREYGRTPLAKSFDRLDHLAEPRHAVAYRFIDALPRDAAVSATSAVGVHLTARRDLFMFPDLPPDAQFVFVDTHAIGVLFPSREAYAAAVRALLEGPDAAWGVWRDGAHVRGGAEDSVDGSGEANAPIPGYDEGYLILRRGADTSANPALLARLNFAPRGQ